MLRLVQNLSKHQQSIIAVQRKQLGRIITKSFAQKQENVEDVSDIIDEEVIIKKKKHLDDEGEDGLNLEKSQNNHQKLQGEEDEDIKSSSASSSYNKRSSDKRSSSTYVKEYQARTLRTSQDSSEQYEPLSFGVTKEEAQEYYLKQLENLDKHMPLNVFSCLNLNEQQEKAMRYLLQDDEQRNLRGKIASIFKRVSESGVNEELVNSLEELIQTANFKEQSFFISERDFKQLIFNKEFIRIVPLFYNKRFFQANQSFLTQIDVIQIFKKCKQDPDFYPLFELLRYHKNFFSKNAGMAQKFTSSDKEIVQQFIYEIRADSNSKLNHLLVFFAAHNLVRLNLSSLLEAGEISKHFSKIHFGHMNDKVRSDFQSRLHELLNLKIKLGLSTSLQHYLCDNFFSFENYESGISSIAMHILILARLSENHNNLNDLFAQYIQTFSQHKFDFYIKDNLPQILQTLQNKTLYNNLQDALKLYASQNKAQNNNNQLSQSSQQQQNKTIEFQRLTYFDNAFAVKNGVISVNYELMNQSENINYRYELSNILNVDKQGYSSSKLNQFQDTYILNQREAIVENLLKESTFNSEISNAARKKQKELEELKKTNPSAYYNQMFSFVYNSLDEAYQNEDPSIKYYFKSRNISTPAPSLFNLSKNAFSTTNTAASNNKNVDDLQDDISAQQTNDPNSELKASKAFSEFMAKVREIDRVSEKSNPFVTKDDINKMKNLQNEEGQSQKDHQTASQTLSAEETAKKEVSAPITKPANSQFFTEFFENLTNLDEGVLRLEKELYDQRSSYQSVINGLCKMEKNFVHDYPEGKYLLYKAFTTPQLYKKQPQLGNLVNKQNWIDSQSTTAINAKTLRLGEISRDYKQYLEETVFGLPLEYPGYNSLLEVCSVHYKRKFFKRILTHIVVTRAKLDKTTIESIVNICKENKLGVTLFEFTYLLANDPKSTITQQQFILLLNSLKSFEDVHEDIETLVRVYLNANLTRKFDNKIIESYINSLIRAKNINKLMSMLERFRDFFLIRKIPYDENLSSEANAALAEKFKQEQKEVTHSLFRLYMQKLTSSGLNHFARPLFQELINMKYSLNESDYILGFKSMDDKPEDIEVLYEQLIEQQVVFGIDIIRCLLEIFKKHPKPLSALTLKVLNEQIYNEKIAIEVSEVNDIAFLFTRNEIPSDFSDLLKFLLNHPHKVNDFTKLTSYRIVNSISEEMLKSFMKGQVETLFSSQKQEQLRQQLLQDRTKKRNTRRQTDNNTNNEQQQQQQQNKNVSVKQQSSQQQQQQQQQQNKSNNTTTTATAATTGTAQQGEAGVQQGEKVTKVKKIYNLGGGRELEVEESVDGPSQEEIAQSILAPLTDRKIIEKESKRKVLRKAGVSKFKDIENYIKDLRTNKEEK